MATIDSIIEKKKGMDIPNRKLSNDYEIHSSGSKMVEIPLKALVEAPKEWNFYNPLSEGKMQELIDSILEVGLLHPIIVWEQERNTYMILSGHNRVKAFNILSETVDKEKYSKIDVVIKNKDEIDNNTAKQIIVDTNWIQRDLSTMEKAKSIVQKYIYTKSQNDSKGIKVDINEAICNEYNLKRTQFISYKSLINLIPHFQELVDNNILYIEPAVQISKFDKELQKYILETYSSDMKLLNKLGRKIKKQFSKEDIDNLFAENKKVEYGELEITYAGLKDGSKKISKIKFDKKEEELFKSLANIFSKNIEDINKEDFQYIKDNFIFEFK